MPKTSREYWQHKPTGHIWAIELSEGRVARCCGPIFLEDVEARLLNHLMYDAKDLSWVVTHRKEFRPYFPPTTKFSIAG